MEQNLLKKLLHSITLHDRTIEIHRKPSKRTEKEIKPITNDLDSVIFTIPKIGPINGATILGELETFTNFLIRKNWLLILA